jgi:hypothetical protein
VFQRVQALLLCVAAFPDGGGVAGGLIEGAYWIFEHGTWLGRVKGKDDKVSWIPQAELRRAEQF